MATIDDNLAKAVTEALRQAQIDISNQDKLLVGPGDVTLTKADGTLVTGPSWPKMSSAVNAAVQWRGNLPANANLNAYGPTSAFTGQWSRSVTSNTTAAYNFPEDAAPGIFDVMAGGLQGCTQRYTTGSGNVYIRSLTAAWNGVDGPWAEWKLAGVNTRPGFYSGDLNSLVAPGTWSTTNTVTNAPTISGSTTVITGICEVILRNASNTVLQRFTNMSSSTLTYNFTWQRTLYGTTWSPWELMGTKALNDLGIGIPVPMVSAMDWQTFNFIPGAQHVCLPSNQTNIPSGLTYAGTSSPTNINVLGGRANTTALVMLVTQFTQSTAAKSFIIVMSGVAGSRTFAIYENFTTGSVIPVANGGTGLASPFGTAAGTFTQGNDSRLGTVAGKSGGTISSPVDVSGALSVIGQSSSYGEMSFKYPGTLQKMAYGFCENYGDLVFVTTQAANAGTEKYFSFRGDKFTTPGNITCVSLTQTSDADKKDDIKPIENALDKVLSLDGVTFNWKDSGLPSAGVIAQQLIDILPEAVGAVFDDRNHYEEMEETEEVEEVGENGEITKVSRTFKVNRLVKPLDESKRSYTVEYSGVVALCLQAIKELNAKVETLEKKLNPQETEEQPDVQQ